MSHFTVLVIGDDFEAQLQPFHEFECSGIVDKYVQEIDHTDEARQKYDKDTTTCLRAADGSLHSFFDEKCEWRPEFSRPDTTAPSWDNRRRVCHAPEGFEQIEAPTSLMQSFAEFVDGYYGWQPVPHGEAPDLEDRHKYGYALLDEFGDIQKCVARTNPNSKWDWWTIGGRWKGFLKLKLGATGVSGEEGVMGSHFAKGADRADQARKGDIDFDGMRDQAGEKSGAYWDKANAITGGESWESWGSVRDRICGTGDSFDRARIDEAREFYQGQRPVAALKEGDPDAFGWSLDDALAGTRDNYVQASRDQACTTFAVIKDGQWFEKGSMGWWGMVSGETDQAEWNRQFNELIDGLPDDTLLTVVDCHI